MKYYFYYPKYNGILSVGPCGCCADIWGTYSIEEILAWMKAHPDEPEELIEADSPSELITMVLQDFPEVDFVDEMEIRSYEN